MTAGCDHKWISVGGVYKNPYGDKFQAYWCENCGTIKKQNFTYSRGTQYMRPQGVKDKAPNTNRIPTTDSVNPEQDELLNRIREQSGDL